VNTRNFAKKRNSMGNIECRKNQRRVNVLERNKGEKEKTLTLVTKEPGPREEDLCPGTREWGWKKDQLCRQENRTRSLEKSWEGGLHRGSNELGQERIWEGGGENTVGGGGGGVVRKLQGNQELLEILMSESLWNEREQTKKGKLKHPVNR